MMFKMVASERSCNCCKQSCFNSPLLISCLDRRKEWEEEEKEKSRRNVVGFNIEPLDGRERKVARTLLLSSVATDIYVGSFFIYIYSERRGDERMRELRNGPVGPTAAKSSAAYRSSSQTWDCQLRQDRARVFPFSSPPLFLLPIHSKWPTFTIFAQIERKKRERRAEISPTMRLFGRMKKGRARKL